MLPFRIALRFLTSGKGQTMLIILGIAVGVSVQIFIGSLIQGLQTNLIDITVGKLFSHYNNLRIRSKDYREMETCGSKCKKK